MDIKVDCNTVVVFDLDDTLYNELDFLISAYREISIYIDKSKYKKIFALMFSLFRNNKDVFEYLSTKYSIEKEFLLAMYRQHKPDIKVSHEIFNLLQKIKNSSGKLALLSDGRSSTQRNKLDALNIKNIFDYISISEEIKAIKPSLRGFQLIEDKFNAKHYYYIGDNLYKDFKAPKKLKWKTIFLIDNGKNIHYNVPLNLEKIKEPDYYIFSLNEINII